MSDISKINIDKKEYFFKDAEGRVRAEEAATEAKNAAKEYTDAQVNALKGAVSADFNTLEKIEDKIEELDSSVDERFVNLNESLDTSFDEIDEQIGSTNAKVSQVETTANNALTLAQNKNLNKVFETTSAMYTWLANAANKGQLQVGSALYIKEADVPDWWVTEVLNAPNADGRYYNIAPLEAEGAGGPAGSTVSVQQTLTSGTKIGSITVDGTPTNLYAPNSVATTSANGLMSKQDKSKLNATNIAYGTCSTAAATAAKVITVNGNTNWALTAGAMITIKFSATNTAQNPTFNVNSTGAKSVWYNTALITTGSLGYAGTANRPMNFIYDGTQYVFIGWSMDTNTTYTNASLGQGYGTCTTAAATTTKVVTLSNYALIVGGVVAVKFTYAVPASATMNINSKGAKNIFHRGSAITANVISAGDIATFIYDGTQYHLISIDYGRGTASNYGYVKLSDSYTSSEGAASASVAASSKAVTDAYNEINSNLTRKFVMLTGDNDGAPFIEYSGNVCVLQYTNVNWIQGQKVPSELMHTSVNSIWATVTSPVSSTDEYRIFIDTSGYISLQKNGLNLTEKTKIRGQIIWIR